MDVAEQAAFVGLREAGTGPQLYRSADVVQQRGADEQVAAHARVQMRRLAAEGGDADGVLEQAARVAVVLRARRQAAQRAAELGIGDEALHGGVEPRVRELTREELEKAVQLVGVAAQRRSEVAGVGVRRSRERAHVELKPVVEALDAPEHAYGVTLGEALVEQLDVVPDARLDPPARVDQLERKVRRPRARVQPAFARHRVDALDDPVLGQLRDRAHDWYGAGSDIVPRARSRALPGGRAGGNHGFPRV